MSTLNRKLARDLRRRTGTLLTIVAIIAIGTGSLIGFASAHRVLTTSQAVYYREYRFADFWVDVKKAPLSVAERIAALPGVADVDARVTFDVILDLPHVAEPLTGMLLSAPETGFEQSINGLCLLRGSGFSADRDEEIILSEAFAEAHGLDPGDQIQLILNRKRQNFLIVGTAISPEYVYMVRGQGDIIPDPEHFGILYIKEDYAREVLDFQDACNQIVGRLVPGAEDDLPVLLDRIDRLLEPFGVLAVTPRDRQASHRFLSDEIEGLGTTAAIMPAIFLSVAALVLNILMSRLAERQRSIIGTLKALGYSDRAVMVHFLGFGLVIGVAGGLGGALVGKLNTYGMVEMYKGFFQFPRFIQATYPDLMALGMAISVVFAVAGTLKGAWAVLRLQPAEAMRQKPPARGGSIILERLPWLWRRFGFRTHLVLRGMFRNRIRTATSIACSALATSIILLSIMMYESMGFLVEFQFERVLHSDVDVGLRDVRSTRALYEARDLPGVDDAEPVLAMTCDLRHGRRQRRMSVVGLSADHRLTTPVGANLEPVIIPPEGLVMSEALADILDLDVGDRFDLTPVRGRRHTESVWLASTVDGYFGVECYADQRYLSRLVGEPLALNSVQMRVDPTKTRALFRRLKTIPNAQGLGIRANARKNIESTFVGTMLAFVFILILFAGVVAFGSMLNQSLIEIGDRLREVSTFRVLGYDNRQVAGIFFLQNIIIFLLGLVGSVPLGYGMLSGIAQAYDAELFRMPVIVETSTVLTTAAVSFVFVLIVQGFVYRQIVGIDWLEGIKVKE